LVLARDVFVIVPEYQRVVFFRFGRVTSKARGPGLIFKMPIRDRVVKVNLRVEVVDIPSQSVITKDNVTIQVDAVVYFQVVDPIRAVIGVDNFRFASQRIAMTSLRSIVGRYELDSLLEHREGVNSELRSTIARHTTEWGVEVRQVEIRDITLPPELLRAMARQAEAERERRAKIIAATGELQASQELSEAADRLMASPGALQLRTLQTLAEVATERNSTLIFPIPVELLSIFQAPSEVKTQAAVSKVNAVSAAAQEAALLARAPVVGDDTERAIGAGDPGSAGSSESAGPGGSSGSGGPAGSSGSGAPAGSSGSPGPAGSSGLPEDSRRDANDDSSETNPPAVA
jgi:regulator of protease activity HflC (stomatin/prohibitin superfamily)